MLEPATMTNIAEIDKPADALVVAEARPPEAAATSAADARPANEPPARPAHVPDKFWDAATGEVRVDAVLKSYAELEKKLGGVTTTIPPSPDAYTIAPKEELLQSNAEVNARLHAAGFSQEQAQVAYDLAAEYLVPMIADVASLFEAENQTERLVRHFGGEPRWREVSRQLDTWAKSNLPAHVFDALKCTADGVLALHQMMVSGEPGLMHDGGQGAGVASDQALKQMMRDPRYWRDQDPTFVEQVRSGFRQLYPDQH